MSSLSHESSIRDSKTNIKVNRTNRPHRTISSEHLGTKSQSKMYEQEGEKTNPAFEKLEVLKSILMLVKQHESQSNNLLLASECSDHLIEAYDVLIALYETPVVSGDIMVGNNNRRATVENVAKHLISRLDMASTVAANSTVVSGSSSLSPSSEGNILPQNYFLGSNQMAWDESSAYSHTTG